MTWPVGGQGLLEKERLTFCAWRQSSRGHLENPIHDPALETFGLSSTRYTVSGCRRVGGTGPTRQQGQKVSIGPSEVHLGQQLRQRSHVYVGRDHAVFLRSTSHDMVVELHERDSRQWRAEIRMPVCFLGHETRVT